MFAMCMALRGLFKDFMAHASGRCTLIGKEKIRLEQDVSFGTKDIDMHRLTFTIFVMILHFQSICTHIH